MPARRAREGRASGWVTAQRSCRGPEGRRAASWDRNPRGICLQPHGAPAEAGSRERAGRHAAREGERRAFRQGIQGSGCGLQRKDVVRRAYRRPAGDRRFSRLGLQRIQGSCCGLQLEDFVRRACRGRLAPRREGKGLSSVRDWVAQSVHDCVASQRSRQRLSQSPFHPSRPCPPAGAVSLPSPRLTPRLGRPWLGRAETRSLAGPGWAGPPSRLATAWTSSRLQVGTLNALDRTRPASCQWHTSVFI